MFALLGLNKASALQTIGLEIIKLATDDYLQIILQWNESFDWYHPLQCEYSN